jgi:catechol 2,3-dioxygenase-like lactoylglutathione lyase family enzyme
MKLNQVTIPSSNVERSINFYQKLGLKLIVRALPHYARFELPEGEATFSLHLVDELPIGEGVYVYFESDRLDALVKELLTQGIEFDEMPEDRRWLWREARLKDPDGNRLILYYAGENRKNPPWRIFNTGNQQ